MATKKKTTTKKATKRKPKQQRTPIILCCGKHGRAVVYGWVDEVPTPGEPVTLHDARMVLRWSAECGGLLGLAARGPRAGTRITAAVPRTQETRWQEWVECTPEGQEAIDAWPAC